MCVDKNDTTLELGIYRQHMLLNEYKTKKLGLGVQEMYCKGAQNLEVRIVDEIDDFKK